MGMGRAEVHRSPTSASRRLERRRARPQGVGEFFIGRGQRARMCATAATAFLKPTHAQLDGLCPGPLVYMTLLPITSAQEATPFLGQRAQEGRILQVIRARVGGLCQGQHAPIPMRRPPSIRVQVVGRW